MVLVVILYRESKAAVKTIQETHDMVKEIVKELGMKTNR
jgi:hypothetical protein